MSKREAILVIVLIIVAVAFSYYRFRYRFVSREIGRQYKQNVEMDRKLKQFKLKREPRINSKQLQKEIDQIEQVQEQVSSQIQYFENHFVPLDSPESIQRVKVEISSLARKNRVLITESIPYQAGFARVTRAKGVHRNLNHNLNILKKLEDKKYLDRPLRKITLRARYRNLLQFVEGLGTLSSKVTVVQLNLNTIQQEDVEANPKIIEAQLVIVL